MRSIVVALAFITALPALAAKSTAIVSTRTIYPGDLITVGDLKSVVLVREPLIRYRFVSHAGEILGMVATRTMLPGRFIRAGSVRQPFLIKAGAPTKVSYQSGGLTIVLDCVALSDASVGDSLKLRNPASGKILIGIVQQDASVVVNSL